MTRHHSWSHAATSFLLVALALACGSRTAVSGDPPPAGPTNAPEACNGLDDDGDGKVDEDFRDPSGRYVHAANCGACDAPCPDTLPNALGVECAVVLETPRCVATRCAPGFAKDASGECVPAYGRMCLPCTDDASCGSFAEAKCVVLGGERRCGVDCSVGCPQGYACKANVCVPTGGSCSCDPGERFDVACSLKDPGGLVCVGTSRCEDGVLSPCATPREVCDGIDNDCNGVVDDGFRDARGAYGLDLHNCGACGVDCTKSPLRQGTLVCGGDPFAPTCVLECRDSLDGIQPGDRLDADRDIENGCECTVQSTGDTAGPVNATAGALDTNCDGADGVVVESYYVAPSGDDGAPGSPTRPLKTIGEATKRAAASIGKPGARPHVFVASGAYVESVSVPDGVKLHGGYRRDFLALDPAGFKVEVRAPTNGTAPGGAALDLRDAGVTDTVVEWISVRGLDAATPGAAAFGAYVQDPGARLTLREIEVRAGVPGAGSNGRSGVAGTAGVAAATAGSAPRSAAENANHTCLAGAANVVTGGRGGAGTCGAVDVSGGDGGSATCPRFGTAQPAGARGRGPAGGAGGTGGVDTSGPIRGATCNAAGGVCCGLADFTVPQNFTGPQSGTGGSSGIVGTAGRGCAEPLGRFVGASWVGDVATRGSDGAAGSGGGGGGAGGGAEIEFVLPRCGFTDALGGGGGGGGAGGCGGGAGEPATSGGPSVAMVVRYTRTPSAAPTLRGATLQSSPGGRGGDGGAGGDGGLGASGSFGQDLARSLRTTPSLAGGFAGGRGGKGGNGGAGGGGGGGCGGASVGVWITGATSAPAGSAAWQTANTFRTSSGGAAGRGGGGAAAAGAGAAGGSIDVLVR